MAQFRRLAEPDKGRECLHCLVGILIEISNEKKAGEDFRCPTLLGVWDRFDPVA